MTSSPPASAVNTPQCLEALWGTGTPCPFDDVIDVRSPGEYAEDHLPGSVNLPVLSDDERIEVGTLYSVDRPDLRGQLVAAFLGDTGLSLDPSVVARRRDFEQLAHQTHRIRRRLAMDEVVPQVDSPAKNAAAFF